jgi:cell division protein FtsZ
MEELNRHVNDRTQLFMGIGVDPRMGNRLSVSILSSLGEETKRSDVRPVRHRSGDLLETNSGAPAIAPVPVRETPAAVAPPPKPITPASVKVAEQPIEQSLVEEEERPARRGPKPDLKPKPPPAKMPEAKQETLQFEPVSRGRFEKSEPTIIDGQDLDVPTFLRKGVPKNR